MAFLVFLAVLEFAIYAADGARVGTQELVKSLDLGELWTEDSGDCSWAKLDTSTGWGCETLKTFSGGMQGNTKLVKLHPPGGGAPFKAVLKEMNSNQNPMGLHSLENERKVAEYLTDRGFKDMPAYYLNLKVDPKFVKYENSATMTLSEKDHCDHKLLYTGLCKINPLWDACNGHRGNIDTTVEIPRSQIRTKGLACPDTQLLAMEFLEGYQDLKGLQPTLRGESGFLREVRAAALFLSYDGMNKAGASHCDFNPGNAMFKVDDPRVAKIIDFGLARLNDHPTGACRGNLEDIGRPGFLWLSLYRGQRDEMEFGQNDRKAGPLALGTNAPFETPSGKTMQPFSLMRGKFEGKGGNGKVPWNRETRNNWPGIVAYARVLMKEAGGAPSSDSPSWDDADWLFASSTTTSSTADHQEQEPEEGPSPGAGPPKCSQVYADRSYVCKLSLYDRSPCTVTLRCRDGQVIKQDVDPASAFGGRVEVDNCNQCKVV